MVVGSEWWRRAHPRRRTNLGHVLGHDSEFRRRDEIRLTALETLRDSRHWYMPRVIDPLQRGVQLVHGDQALLSNDSTR